jgi:hypothetical protein
MNIPVVFIIFNRPETTLRVFEAIRQAKPTRLLVVADGPRHHKPGEKDLCNDARAIIDKVDWDCKVYKDFAESNMGCKNRVASGISWAFSLVEQAIILEDDCLPSPSFFRFCKEMLERYKEDERIMLVSGDNRLFGARETDNSYYFSRYPNIWGWATWRRAWSKFDIQMSAWPRIRNENGFDQYFKTAAESYYWKSMFDYVYAGKLDTWDYQWVYSIFKESGLSIAPGINLVENIGFTEEATHTKAISVYAKLKAGDLIFPLSHPENVLIDTLNDKQEQKIRIHNVGMMPYPLNYFKDKARDILSGSHRG